jgi:hypothetical protein
MRIPDPSKRKVLPKNEVHLSPAEPPYLPPHGRQCEPSDSPLHRQTTLRRFSQWRYNCDMSKTLDSFLFRRAAAALANVGHTCTATQPTLRRTD